MHAQVIQRCTPACQHQVLTALSRIQHLVPEGLKEGCVQSAVSMLSGQPDNVVDTALEMLYEMCALASPSLGEVFTNVGGPEVLHRHLMTETGRNAALEAVLAIANNPQLCIVRDKLLACSGRRDLATLCENCPPVKDDTKRLSKMQTLFEMAFGRAPTWGVTDKGTDKVCYPCWKTLYCPTGTGSSLALVKRDAWICAQR